MRNYGGGFRKTVHASGLEAALRELRERTRGRPVAFVCIGTDRSTGDAFGPLAGTLLLEAGGRTVIGTLERPCDASNLPARLQEVPPDRVVIAVDASVGRSADVGAFTLAEGPVRPGRSLGKPLPEVGAFSVTGIVNENRANPYAVLQTTSLYTVMGMARALAEAICAVFPPDERP